MSYQAGHPASQKQFRDRKRWGSLLSVVGPSIATLGPLAHLLGATSFWWFALPLVLFYGFIPLADWWLGEDPTNPPESLVPELESDAYYRWILYATIPVLWASVLFNLVYLATHELPPAAWLALVMATGSVLGFGLNLSHELGHKQDWLGRKLALFNNALGGYGHFSIEHNRGHHRHVSTPEDPASARLGESIYCFVLREMPGAFFRAWTLESDRLSRRGSSAWHPDNEILQAGLFTVILYGGLVAGLGWSMAAVFPLVAFWGAFQLTSANYIEHYGLQRKRGLDGTYERCGPHHSWNSNHLISNLVCSSSNAIPITTPTLGAATSRFGTFQTSHGSPQATSGCSWWPTCHRCGSISWIDGLFRPQTRIPSASTLCPSCVRR